MKPPDPHPPDSTCQELHRLTQIPPGDEIDTGDEAAESWRRFAQLLSNADAGLEAPGLTVSPLEKAPPRRGRVQQLAPICAAVCLAVFFAGVAAAVYVGQASNAGSGQASPQQTKQRNTIAAPQSGQQRFIQNNQTPVRAPRNASGDDPPHAPVWDDPLQQQIIAAYDVAPATYDGTPAASDPQYQEIEEHLRQLSSELRFTLTAIRDGAL